MSALPTFAEILANCTVYKPRVGNKARTFKTPNEAMNYERGFLEFPKFDVGTYAGQLGYDDAEAADQARHEARAERQEAKWEER